MDSEQTSQVTHLLLAWRDGDRSAEAALLPLVYQELHRLASSYMAKEHGQHTLQATALVHEAYLRLTGQPVNWTGRSHFMAVAANSMRHVLVDYARNRMAVKRGGGAVAVALEENCLAAGHDESWTDLLALHQAMERFAAIDPRAARVVELRFFTGLDLAETAAVLNVSTRTIKRDWESAQAWLHRELVSQR